MPPRFLGIDFSGSAAAWRPRCRTPTVWIATIEATPALALVDLRSVQDLPGEGAPFARLAALLAAGDYRAAAIDAPFSIPREFLPGGRHDALLAGVRGLPDAPDRPFPSGDALVRLAEAVAPRTAAKPLRETERTWSRRRVNTRSTLWNGPRGGAPFAAACLALLGRAGRPLWPWTSAPGTIAEAFPAAQLREWSLPHQGYAAPEQGEVRRTIVAAVARRLRLLPEQRALVEHSPDALDAVLAAFGAYAAAAQAHVPWPEQRPEDGWIAVLRADAALPDPVEPERFELLAEQGGVRIERITSRGHVTPPDQPYLQPHAEWVTVIAGAARLKIEGEEAERALAPGDHLLIPGGARHWVTSTEDPTIWIAVHFPRLGR